MRRPRACLEPRGRYRLAARVARAVAAVVELCLGAVNLLQHCLQAVMCGNLRDPFHGDTRSVTDPLAERDAAGIRRGLLKLRELGEDLGALRLEQRCDSG